MVERLMARKTAEELIRRKSDLENQLKELGAQHEGGQQWQALHDDPVFEQALNILRGRIAALGDLSEVKHIIPLENPQEVVLGVKDEIDLGGGEKMIGAFLSPDDAKSIGSWEGEGWRGVEIISSEGSLGKAIIGKKIGDEASLKPGQKIKILGISAASI